MSDQSDPTQINKDTAVSIRYTLCDDSGDELDSNREGDPLTYIQGHGQLVEGVEKELQGKEPGYKTKIIVPPEEGYGAHNDELMMTLPKDRFDFEVQPGMVLHAQTAHGTIPLQVVEVSDEGVKVDGNHPLAGKTLHFEIEVIEIRAATAEELQHGHACHGCGEHEPPPSA